MKVDDVVFRDDLYPRGQHNIETVQQYAQDLEVLPPIEVNQLNELIDGRHRWLAFKESGATEIPAKVTKTKSDMQLLEFAIERNNAHGLQLSIADKQDMARKIYANTRPSERNEKKEELARLLSVGHSTVRDWLSRIDKDSKASRNRRIKKLWESCYTEQEIADREGMSQKAVNLITDGFSSFADLSKTTITAENFEDRIGRPPPIYNVWKVQNKSNKTNHFGNSEQAWVENLLFKFSKPGEIVVDPFAGGASTRDACRKFGCRFWLGDRVVKPAESELLESVRTHDIIVNGLPVLTGKWKDVALVYLDPPYWRQAFEKYSKDKTDLANMDLDEFHAQMVKIVNGFLGKLRKGGKVAMILQPTQWKADNRAYTDHILEICRKVNHSVVMRIQAPYESQQCTAQMVSWVKENPTYLVLSREIVVWEKS